MGRKRRRHPALQCQIVAACFKLCVRCIQKPRADGNELIVEGWNWASLNQLQDSGCTFLLIVTDTPYISRKVTLALVQLP